LPAVKILFIYWQKNILFICSYKKVFSFLANNCDRRICCSCSTTILCNYIVPFLGFCFRFDMMGIMLLLFIVPVLGVCISLIFSYMIDFFLNIWAWKLIEV